MEMNLVYMAKPIYGGWVTCTAHMCLKYNSKLFKIAKRTEPNFRDFGYGVSYKNLRIDDLLEKTNLMMETHSSKFGHNSSIVSICSSLTSLFSSFYNNCVGCFSLESLPQNRWQQ